MVWTARGHRENPEKTRLCPSQLPLRRNRNIGSRGKSTELSRHLDEFSCFLQTNRKAGHSTQPYLLQTKIQGISLSPIQNAGRNCAKKIQTIWLTRLLLELRRRREPLLYYQNFQGFSFTGLCTLDPKYLSRQLSKPQTGGHSSANVHLPNPSYFLEEAHLHQCRPFCRSQPDGRSSRDFITSLVHPHGFGGGGDKKIDCVEVSYPT